MDQKEMEEKARENWQEYLDELMKRKPFESVAMKNIREEIDKRHANSLYVYHHSVVLNNLRANLEDAKNGLFSRMRVYFYASLALNVLVVLYILMR